MDLHHHKDGSTNRSKSTALTIWALRYDGHIERDLGRVLSALGAHPVHGQRK